MSRYLILSLLLLGLVIAAGCGGSPDPVVEEPVVPEPVETEPIPEEPVAEEPEPEPEPVTPDYSTMAPQEYGIEDVFFAFDEFTLSTEAMGTLEANARIMMEHSDLVYVVEGHCDERGTVGYNLALGEKRAVAVRDYLMSLGIPSSQLRLTTYGEERPFAHGSNESAWALNRRGHFSRP